MYICIIILNNDFSFCRVSQVLRRSKLDNCRQLIRSVIIHHLLFNENDNTLNIKVRMIHNTSVKHEKLDG